MFVLDPSYTYTRACVLLHIFSHSYRGIGILGYRRGDASYVQAQKEARGRHAVCPFIRCDCPVAVVMVVAAQLVSWIGHGASSAKGLVLAGFFFVVTQITVLSYKNDARFHRPRHFMSPHPS